MAIQAYTQVPGMSSEMYDGMFAQASPALLAAPGFIAHIATPMEGGMAVTELWESQEAMETFLNAHVYPMAEAAGMPLAPPMVATIHNIDV